VRWNATTNTPLRFRFHVIGRIKRRSKLPKRSETLPSDAIRTATKRQASAAARGGGFEISADGGGGHARSVAVFGGGAASAMVLYFGRLTRRNLCVDSRR